MFVIARIIFIFIFLGISCVPQNTVKTLGACGETDCPETSTPPSDIVCPTGFHNVRNICYPDQICVPFTTKRTSCSDKISYSSLAYTEETCRMDGKGYESDGICQLKSCLPGYDISGSSCLPSTTCTPGSQFTSSCYIIHASNAEKVHTCKDDGLGYTEGICEVKTCYSGFYKEFNYCETQLCTPGSSFNSDCTDELDYSSSATRVEVCNTIGNAYDKGTCLATSCQVGYFLENNECHPQICSPNSYQIVDCLQSEAPFSKEAKKTRRCNSLGTDFVSPTSSCQIISCIEGYSLVGNNCVEDGLACQAGLVEITSDCPSGDDTTFPSDPTSLNKTLEEVRYCLNDGTGYSNPVCRPTACKDETALDDNILDGAHLENGVCVLNICEPGTTTVAACDPSDLPEHGVSGEKSIVCSGDGGNILSSECQLTGCDDGFYKNGSLCEPYVCDPNVPLDPKPCASLLNNVYASYQQDTCELINGLPELIEGNCQIQSCDYQFHWSDNLCLPNEGFTTIPQSQPSFNNLPSNNITCIYYDSETHVWYVGTDAGLAISYDDGTTFYNRTTADGLFTNWITDIAPDVTPNSQNFYDIFFAVEDFTSIGSYHVGGIPTAFDVALYATPITCSGTTIPGQILSGFTIESYFDNGGVIFAGNSSDRQGLRISPDGGSSWIDKSVDSSGKNLEEIIPRHTGNIQAFDFLQHRSGRVFYFSDKNIWRTDDQGKSFTSSDISACNTVDDPEFFIRDFEYIDDATGILINNKYNAGRIIISTTQGFCSSDNGGDTFTPITIKVPSLADPDVKQDLVNININTFSIDNNNNIYFSCSAYTGQTTPLSDVDYPHSCENVEISNLVKCHLENSASECVLNTIPFWVSAEITSIQFHPVDHQLFVSVYKVNPTANAETGLFMTTELEPQADDPLTVSVVETHPFRAIGYEGDSVMIEETPSSLVHITSFSDENDPTYPDSSVSATLKTFATANKAIASKNKIKLMEDGRLFITHARDFFIYSDSQGKIFKAVKMMKDPNGPSLLGITDIAYDQGGRIILSTFNEGIFVINDISELQHHQVFTPTQWLNRDSNHLPSNDVFSIYYDKSNNKIFAGTRAGYAFIPF